MMSEPGIVSKTQLTNSFNKLCSLIIRHRSFEDKIVSYANYSGLNFGAFKRAANLEYYKCICRFLKNDENFNYTSKDIGQLIAPTKTELVNMTKAAIEDKAREFGFELDRRLTKDKMIAEFQKLLKAKAKADKV